MATPKKIIIVHYSLCEGNSLVEEHYIKLSIATSTIPTMLLLTIGEFNSHISETNLNRYTYITALQTQTENYSLIMQKKPT